MVPSTVSRLDRSNLLFGLAQSAAPSAWMACFLSDIDPRPRSPSLRQPSLLFRIFGNPVGDLCGVDQRGSRNDSNLVHIFWLSRLHCGTGRSGAQPIQCRLHLRTFAFLNSFDVVHDFTRKSTHRGQIETSREQRPWLASALITPACLPHGGCSGKKSVLQKWDSVSVRSLDDLYESEFLQLPRKGRLEYASATAVDLVRGRRIVCLIP
jgi:hypothetical protein